MLAEIFLTSEGMTRCVSEWREHQIKKSHVRTSQLKAQRGLQEA